MPLSQLLNSSDSELRTELQVILNAVVEGLCGLDAEGKVTFCNDALLKMTGYGTEEIIGSAFDELLHHGPPDGSQDPGGECAFRKAIDSRQAIHIVPFCARQTGSLL
jgi:PAS domain S-box-containing protein